MAKQKQYSGKERGKDSQFMKAMPQDIYPGAIVYGRHHSNYIKGTVRCNLWGLGIKVDFPNSAPGSWPPMTIGNLFVKVD